MSKTFLPSGQSRDKAGFPPDAESRDCPESAVLVAADRADVGDHQSFDVFLPPARLGQCCDPPLRPDAVAFEAALHNWRSRTRTLPGGKFKLEYSLGDAIKTLGPRLAGPLALAVIDQWQHVSYLRFPMSRVERLEAVESQRELIEKRLGVLHVWRAALRQRPNGCNALQATFDFVRAWNREHPELRVCKSGLYRWWGAYQSLGVAGLADVRLIGPQKRCFKRIIPAPFWRALWRQHLCWWIPRMQTVIGEALRECSGEIRTECERLIESGTVQRRMLTVPDAVRNLLPLAKPAPSYSRKAASLARSRRVLQLLLTLSEAESTADSAGSMIAAGGQP